jgi:superfamily II DNA helicase RecQ
MKINTGNIIDTWIQPDAVLALTATAPLIVAQDITQRLYIKPMQQASGTTNSTTISSSSREPCYIHRAGSWYRPNLQLSVYNVSSTNHHHSNEGALSQSRLKLLLSILKKESSQEEFEKEHEFDQLKVPRQYIFILKKDREILTFN